MYSMPLSVAVFRYRERGSDQSLKLSVDFRG
jgi:hypothetical protein